MLAEIFTSKMRESCAICRQPIEKGISAFEPTCGTEIVLCLSCGSKIGQAAERELEDTLRDTEDGTEND